MVEMKSYSKIIEELFNNYPGNYNSLFKNLPKYFNILQNNYSNKDLDWKGKFKINACFSYFIIPQKKGFQLNYLNDLFLYAYVLSELMQEYDSFSESKIGCSLNSVKKVLFETQELIGLEYNDLLIFTGLKKFNDLDENFYFLEVPENKDEKVARLTDEILSLMGLLKTIFILEGKNPQGRKLRDLKKLFDEKEWNKVLNILAKLELHESHFDDSHEKELEKIKRKILLNIDESIFN